jgi:hypothetical protein
LFSGINAVAYSQRLKTYGLADAAKPRATRYIDAFPRVWKTLPTFDVSYLRLLAETIDADLPRAKDAATLAMVASLGIEKGKTVCAGCRARATSLGKRARGRSGNE